MLSFKKEKKIGQDINLSQLPLFMQCIRKMDVTDILTAT